jgi:hypothetical protein
MHIDMKSLNDVITEVKAQIASLQVTLSDLQALAAAPTGPLAKPTEVDLQEPDGSTDAYVPKPDATTDQVSQ